MAFKMKGPAFYKSPMKHKIWGEGGTAFHGDTIDDHYHDEDGKKHKSKFTGEGSGPATKKNKEYGI